MVIQRDLPIEVLLSWVVLSSGGISIVVLPPEVDRYSMYLD
jgi:hypothetical protein